MAFLHTVSRSNDFELLYKRLLPSLDIEAQSYRHKATGLLHYHLSCNKKENAFAIGFATQPTTSRGEAHILEHVALCGSKKYPVRDPFFSMLKRSLQTFMNALTASDWTCYPFATQNQKDFFNLLDVYLDAVFEPLIHPLDFAQEGVRLEVDKQGNLSYQGVVFNEMKGAMSGEIDQLYRALFSRLFPTTTYHYNSGGDPACIPELTHADLLDFHRQHYHPTNAVALSFGDIDPSAVHDALQSHLAAYDDCAKPKRGKKFTPTPERRLSAPIQCQDTYASATDDDNQSHHVVAWLLPAIDDPKTRLALHLLEGVLIGHADLPLRRYLETTPLGQAPSPLLGLDDGHYEMIFCLGVRGGKKTRGGKLQQEILDLLKDIASRPIDQKTIDIALHQMELQKRHIGGDSLPYGLDLLLDGFGSAVHGVDPLDVWDLDARMDWLKDQLRDPMWLSQLIQTHLLDNTHRVLLSLDPDSQKAAKDTACEQARLKTLSAQLSDADRCALKAQSDALQERQTTPDDVDLLPKVELSDISGDVTFADADIGHLGDCPFYQYDIGANGLYYYRLLVSLDDDLAKHSLLPLYTTVLGELGTLQCDARSFQAKQLQCGSGVGVSLSQRGLVGDADRVSSLLILATRSLCADTRAIDVAHETLRDTVFGESDRLKELLTQKQLSWQARLSRAGHSYAIKTACAPIGAAAALKHAHYGMPALASLKRFLDKANQNAALWQTLGEALAAFHQKIQTQSKTVALACASDQKHVLQTAIQESLDRFAHDAPFSQNQAAQTPSGLEYFNAQKILNESQKQKAGSKTAWLIASNVYHNATAIAAAPAGHPDAAAYAVLAEYLKNGYLHSAIREKGGAYGAGALFDASSACFAFFSYRDPHCDETFAHFDKALAWLFEGDHNPRQLQEAILGVVASMDKPGSPSGEALRSCLSQLQGRNKAYYKTLKDRILAVDLNDLRRVGAALQKQTAHRACLAPLTSEEALQNLGFDIHKLP